MKKISFLTEDNVMLDGLLYEPNVTTKEVVISIHGMSSNCFKKRDDIFSQEFTKNNISYFCFNNRGHDFVVSLSKYTDGVKTKIIAGTSYEDVLDSYYDIKSAVKLMLDNGYEKINLLGHSLGSTKIVYTYNKLKSENDYAILDKISSVILLSLVDIPQTMKYYLKDSYNDIIDYSLQKEKENKLNELIPLELYGYPMSVKTFLRYYKYNEEIDFSRYGDDSYNFEKLNNITVPLFMRFGNQNEMILQKADDLVNLLNSKINNNNNKSVAYIDGADHSYSGKELILAKEILDFIK